MRLVWGGRPTRAHTVVQAGEVTHGMTMQVRVRGLRMLMWRVRVAKALFRLAAWVLGVGIQFNFDEEPR